MYISALLGLVSVLGLAVGLPQAARAQPSYLDPTFGTNGIVITPIGTDANARAVVRQPDGALVAGGYAIAGGTSVFALARYESDGDLDPTFGSGGIVTTPIDSSAAGYGLVLQPDGKLVLAGSATGPGGTAIALARYDDGTLDPAFGSGGIVVTPVGTSAIARAIVLQADDKLVIAGSTSTGGSPTDFLLARYETDGTPDATFGTGGIVTTPISSLGDTAHALALQADGMLVAAGTTSTSPSGSRFAVARYDTDGVLDPAFGTGGVVTTGFGGSSSALAVVVQPDQKIVAGGNSLDPGYSIALVRYDTGGIVDPTFGSGGTIYSPISGPAIASLQALANLPSDRLMIGGTLATVTSIRPFTTDLDFTVARLSNGTTFDFATSTGLGSLEDSIGAVAVQPDGKVVAAGTSGDKFALARYLIAVCGDGDLEPGEPCDDGNLASGDGCDANCTPTGCGNDIVTAGETCDDGNTDDGDCCSSICQLDGAGTPCGVDDGDPCYDDVCNATGGCLHQTNTAPCDDGDNCTTDDTCDLGECVGDPVVCTIPCEDCNPANGMCVPLPRPSCRHVAVPGKAKLQLRDLGAGDTHKLIWKWLKGEATTLNAFGHPLTTDDYTLCIYGEAGPAPTLLARATVPAGGTCGNRSCWKATGDKGFKYKDPERTPDGIDTLTLKVGTFLGRSRVIAKGQGADLDLPALPLSLPARVQLQSEGGACWEATYSAAGVLKSDDTMFKGTGQ